MTVLTLSNRDARRLWLACQGLAPAPDRAAPADRSLTAIIRQIGFVQLDTIRVVARAHDHILWSRDQRYREGMLDALVRERAVFEHFTHDASVLPMEFYPYWRRQYERQRHKLEKSQWRKAMPSQKGMDAILKRIEEEGALSTRAFEAEKKKSTHAWARPPHKYALDYYWYGGVLATCHRINFIKHYDLAERVIPKRYFSKAVSDARQIDWLCAQALSRLGFATEGDIQRFWDAADLDEVKGWRRRNGNKLVEVDITCADGAVQRALAPADIEQRLELLKPAPGRLRLLNPFDPVVRDRKRLLRLFGFDYRIEIFIPAQKRQYGYYVYPMIEGERFVGRIEVKADRKAGALMVENLWWEPGVAAGKARLKKLDSELSRLGRFIGVREIKWRCRPG